ncbi:MAG: Abi family protein [Raoultibacter sp.]
MTEHSKIKLDGCGQIEHLKSRGVKFIRCSETDAFEYLATKNFYFKVTAYRKLFEKHADGELDGKYIDLDFAQLVELASLDQRLREALLPMTLDVEHFAKVKIMSIFESDQNEDGYTIIAGYLSSLPKGKRDYIEREFAIRSNDTYCGAIISKYCNDMPLWAFLEIVSFGTFVDFYRFCADRWQRRDLTDEHYHLKYVKAIRNASAHGSCILDALGADDVKPRPAPALMRAMTKIGIPKRLRNKKIANLRLRQIATLFLLYQELVPSGKAADRAKSDLRAFFDMHHSIEESYRENSFVEASVRFIERLTRGFSLS